jgi:hypothetical protein
MAHKSTREEKNERVFRVYKMLCKGESRAEIFHYCRSMWGVSSSMVDHYLSDARVLLAEDFKLEREEFALEILGGLKDLRRRAIADKQYGVALGCLSRMAAITNVDGQNNQFRRSRQTEQ